MSPATRTHTVRLIVLTVAVAGLLLAPPSQADTGIHNKAKEFARTIVDWLFPQPSQADTGLHNSTKGFTRPADMNPSDWSNPAEMRRAWDAAIVYVPGNNQTAVESTTTELQQGKLDWARKVPVVIYMHGCSGVWSGTHLRAKLLAENGFVVVAPASLARKKYPQSCDVDDYTAGMYRQTLKMRQTDAGYAIEQVRKLPFVDGERIVLMGLSQGGITAATFQPQNEQQKVRARIIEGWTCHDNWPEYHGMRAPASEPVLALIGTDDPWFQDVSQGNCQPFLNPENGSVSVVYEDEPLASRHELLEFSSPKQEVIRFLRQHLGRKPGSG